MTVVPVVTTMVSGPGADDRVCGLCSGRARYLGRDLGWVHDGPCGCTGVKPVVVAAA